MSYFFTCLFCLLYFSINLQMNCAFASKNPISISESNSEFNGNEKRRYSRITGGFRPPQHTLAKYVVSIRRRNKFDYKYNNFFGSTHFCGGAILNSKLILTAAHCLEKNGHKTRPYSLEVVTGTPKRLVKTIHTQTIEVSKVIVHHKYDTATLNYDIGLIQLKSEIDLDGIYAQAIPLPRAPPVEGATCVTLGWGNMYMTGPSANEILYVDLSIIDRNICGQLYTIFSDNEICAINLYDSEKDTCNRDSGGPLICNGSVAGIVSYGYVCGYGRPAVYTGVYDYLDWIIRSKADKLGASLWMLWCLSFTWITNFTA